MKFSFLGTHYERESDIGVVTVALNIRKMELEFGSQLPLEMQWEAAARGDLKKPLERADFRTEADYSAYIERVKAKETKKPVFKSKAILEDWKSTEVENNPSSKRKPLMSSDTKKKLAKGSLVGLGLIGRIGSMILKKTIYPNGSRGE